MVWQFILGMTVNRRELLTGILAASVCRPTRADGESHIMQQRVSIITLGVNDLEISRKFYVEGFGWKPVFENQSDVEKLLHFYYT